jgi:hypothetical protein
VPAKPTYLGLLNAVAVAESNAHEYLTAWIAVTPSAEVCAVLQAVAVREGEHGMSFAKRINELGFDVRRKPDPEHGKRLEIAASECSDLEKMRALGLHRLDSGDQPDIFDRFFSDHSIDIRTGELLGRYIAEERDTARLLRACYEQLKASEQASGQRRNGSKGRAATSEHATDQLGVIEEKLDTVCRAVEELRQIVCAQTIAERESGPRRNASKSRAARSEHVTM